MLRASLPRGSIGSRATAPCSWTAEDNTEEELREWTEAGWHDTKVRSLFFCTLRILWHVVRVIFPPLRALDRR